MGQRLNIEISSKGEAIANCYYHWSAYTISSLIELKNILNNYSELKEKYKNKKLLAVKMFESAGAYVGGEDITLLETEFPSEIFLHSIDRNEGIVSISETSMDSTRNFEEGRINVDLDNETFEFLVYYYLLNPYEDFDMPNENEIEAFAYILDMEEEMEEDINSEKLKEAIIKYINEMEDLGKEKDYSFDAIPFSKIDEVIEIFKNNEFKFKEDIFSTIE